MKKKSVLSTFLFIISVLIISGCGSSSGNKTSDEKTDDPTLLFSSARIQIGDSDEYILGVLTEEGDSDSLGIIGNLNSSNIETSITKLLYTTKHGEALVIEINQETGIPSSMYSDDGYHLEFDNFTNNKVDITIYDPNNTVVFGPESFEFTNDKVQQIQTMYPFIESPTKRASKALTSEQKAVWWQFASVVANGVGCVGSVALATAATGASGGLAAPIAIAGAAAACSSFALTAAAALTDWQIVDNAALVVDHAMCVIGEATAPSGVGAALAATSCLAAFADGMTVIYENNSVVYFSDNFENDLSSWTEYSDTNWYLSAGELIGDYNVGCGSPSCSQADIILNNEYQLSGNWEASIDFIRVVDANHSDLFTAFGSFALWEDSNNKISLNVGNGGWDSWGGNQDTVKVTVSVWNGSWNSKVNESVSHSWNPDEWHTAILKKNGTTYSIYFDDLLVYNFDDIYLNGQGKVGLHTYGSKRYDNFVLKSK